jgi:hypothetical protein
MSLALWTIFTKWKLLLNPRYFAGSLANLQNNGDLWKTKFVVTYPRAWTRNFIAAPDFA